jgi:adenosylcobinamide-GDP ribazoletransferase
MLDPFLSTLSLVSRIPLKVKFTFDPSKTDFYLPLTGLFPALLGALVFSLGYLFLGDPLTVIPVLIAQYLAFNLFHLDGLLDTADAFLGTADREKRLALLKDPRIGVYGFFAGIAVLGLKCALLYRLFPQIPRFPAALLAYPLSGRLGAALIPGITKPLKTEGLGALAKNSRPWRAAAGALISLCFWTALVYGVRALYRRWFLNSPGLFNDPAFGAGVFGPPWNTPLPWALWGLPLLSPLTAWFVARGYTKRLGGYTGDALGAAVELGELLHLGGAYIILAIF